MEPLREPVWAITLGVGQRQPVAKVLNCIQYNDLVALSPEHWTLLWIARLSTWSLLII